MDVTEAFDSERRAYESYVDAQRIEIGVAQSTVLRAEARAEDAVRQKEEAFRQRDEAVRQKNEENEQILANALKTLIAQGMSEQLARKTLGIEIKKLNT